jgi:restriction endonuclease S subunit
MMSSPSIKLSDLADIQLGRAYKTAVKDLGSLGNASLIQIGDLNAGNVNSPNKFKSIKLEDKDQKHIIEPGDILVPLRGARFKAYIYESTMKKPVITSNQVAKIKCLEHLCEPYFLCWYLNTSEIANYIDKANEGSSIQKISSPFLKNLLMKVPSIEMQRQIGFVYKNWLNQRELHHKLIESGDVLYENVCKQMLNGKVSFEQLI